MEDIEMTLCGRGAGSLSAHPRDIQPLPDPGFEGGK